MFATLESVRRFVGCTRFAVIVLLGSAGVSTASGQASQDAGRISELYVNAPGAIAVQLDSGFPNASAANQCPTNNGWAGVDAAINPSLKAALLLAKATNSNVIVSTQGCLGGAWLNVVDVYLK